MSQICACVDSQLAIFAIADKDACRLFRHIFRQCVHTLCLTVIMQLSFFKFLNFF